MSADVTIVDGVATVEATGGDLLDAARKLLDAAGDDPTMVSTVTIASGTAFRCSEALARKAGLVAEAKPAAKPAAKRSRKGKRPS